MSFKAQKWAWEQKTKSPLTQLLLFAIAQSENDEKGYAWCSHQYLADKCRCSRRSVMRGLEYLESNSFILIERRSKDGIKTTNLYRVNYNHDVTQVHNDVTDCHKGSDRLSQGGSDRLSHKQITSSNRLINTNTQTEFERWWSQYPIKRGKKPALTAWKRIKPDADLLIADTINKTENDDGWLRGFAPNPTTYLNQERWNDELQSPKPTELTEADKYALRKQRTEAILQELNGHDVGEHVEALPHAVDTHEW